MIFLKRAGVYFCNIVILFSHKSSDFDVNPRLPFLILAVLCGMNLIMALSSSHVILSQSWFTGVEKLKFDCKLLPNSEICFFSPSQSVFL